MTVPGVPDSAGGYATSTAVLFAWQAPVTGGAPTSYETDLNGGSLVNVGLVLESSYTGLTQDTAYTVRVRGRNADGAGPWVTLPLTTGHPPGVPTSVAGELAAGDYVLTWRIDVADEWGAFDVRLDDEDPIEVTDPVDDEADPLEFTYTYAGITAGAHTVSVRTTNQYGVSAWVDLELEGPAAAPTGTDLLAEAGYTDAPSDVDVSVTGARMWLDLPEVYRHADQQQS